MPDAKSPLEAEPELAAAAVERWLLTALQTAMTIASLASASGAADSAETQREAGEWQCWTDLSA
jgi:hypothetical protein